MKGVERGEKSGQFRGDAEIDHRVEDVRKHDVRGTKDLLKIIRKS